MKWKLTLLLLVIVTLTTGTTTLQRFTIPSSLQIGSCYIEGAFTNGTNINFDCVALSSVNSTFSPNSSTDVSFWVRKYSSNVVGGPAPNIPISYFKFDNTNISGNFSNGLIKFHYSDGDISGLGIDESTVKAYLYTGGGWVEASLLAQVSSTDVNLTNNHIWINLSSLTDSDWAISGSAADVTPPELTVNSAQNETITTNYYPVSVSSNEVIGTAVVSFNGTNYLSSCGSSSCSFNTPILGNGNYTIINITINDTAGNTNTSENFWIYINYTVPSYPAPGGSGQPSRGGYYVPNGTVVLSKLNSSYVEAKISTDLVSQRSFIVNYTLVYDELVTSHRKEIYLPIFKDRNWHNSNSYLLPTRGANGVIVKLYYRDVLLDTEEIYLDGDIPQIVKDLLKRIRKKFNPKIEQNIITKTVIGPDESTTLRLQVLDPQVNIVKAEILKPRGKSILYLLRQTDDNPTIYEMTFSDTHRPGTYDIQNIHLSSDDLTAHTSSNLAFTVVTTGDRGDNPLIVSTDYRFKVQKDDSNRLIADISYVGLKQRHMETLVITYKENGIQKKIITTLPEFKQGVVVRNKRFKIQSNEDTNIVLYLGGVEIGGYIYKNGFLRPKAFRYLPKLDFSDNKLKDKVDEIVKEPITRAKDIFSVRPRNVLYRLYTFPIGTSETGEYITVDYYINPYISKFKSLINYKLPPLFNRTIKLGQIILFLFVLSFLMKVDYELQYDRILRLLQYTKKVIIYSSKQSKLGIKGLIRIETLFFIALFHTYYKLIPVVLTSYGYLGVAIMTVVSTVIGVGSYKYVKK